MTTRPRVFRAEGIVLRRRNIGEADSIFTVLGTDGHRFEAVARGVRKARSRMRGHRPVAVTSISEATPRLRMGLTERRISGTRRTDQASAPATATTTSMSTADACQGNRRAVNAAIVRATTVRPVKLTSGSRPTTAPP